MDDIVILYKREYKAEMERFRDDLSKRFPMRNLGELKWFLGVRVIRDRANRKAWLCQDSYIEKIAHRFNLTEERMPATSVPIQKPTKNPQQASAERILEYQQKVGSALFATIITRPDAARAVNKLSEYNLNPSSEHLDSVNRVIQYLYGTRHYAIEYGPTEELKQLIAASNAAFGNNEDRKSTEAFVI